MTARRKPAGPPTVRFYPNDPDAPVGLESAARQGAIHPVRGERGLTAEGLLTRVYFD